MEKNILYTELADWWQLLSSPADYEEEAEVYKNTLLSNSQRRPVTLLELGSGGGNNASYLKKHFQMTLVDISPQMLEVSSRLNPECTHIQGDMRKVRLNQLFDAVFIHDAIVYMCTRAQLLEAIETAFFHLRPGGTALFVPDYTTENFKPATSHGGEDNGDRGLRYLEWTIDEDPDDNMYYTYMVYLLKEGNTMRQSPIDKFECGLFTEKQWLEIIEEAGFIAKVLPFSLSDFNGEGHSMFLGIKPEK